MGSPQKMVIPFLLSISIVYVDHININKAEKPKLANCTLLHFITEKAMAPVLQYSSTLAWKIPWTEEPGGLQSMGSLRVGHN